MKPAPFEYQVPDSLEQAIDLMGKYGGEAKLLAGGQSLVPAMNFRIAQPSALIDLNKVTELDYIQQESQAAVQIGAMTRERRLEFDPIIAKRAPLLAEAMPYVAHPQIRNRGTLGGSLANADPAAELPVIMKAIGARLKVRNTVSERWITATEFFTGMFSTDLATDEMLVEIELPPMPAHTGWSFMEFAPRAGDYALMGVAVLITINEKSTCQKASVVYLNAGDGPVDARETARLLEGERLNQEVINNAAAFASEKEINPFGNIHASIDYQRHLAQVLTHRTLEQAFKRAGEDKWQ
jgi:carbon-monoxide dehydrogenase medium subunit